MPRAETSSYIKHRNDWRSRSSTKTVKNLCVLPAHTVVTVTHPCSNRARRKATSLMKTTALTATVHMGPNLQNFVK